MFVGGIVGPKAAYCAGIGDQTQASSSSVQQAQIDIISPSAVPSGSPDTQFSLTGTGLGKSSSIYVLDREKNWVALPILHPGNSTHVIVTLAANYLSQPAGVLLSPTPDFHLARSILVYSPVIARATVDPNWKIDGDVSDIGRGGSIGITGKNLTRGMQGVLGRGSVAGILLPTRFNGASYLDVDIPDYIPGDNLFIAVLSADGKRLSAPFGVTSSYPEREDEHSQNLDGPTADQLNAEGRRLMTIGKWDAAALKFVEATRFRQCGDIIAQPSKNCAMFANNAGYAYYQLGNYEDSIAWIRKSLEIDPQRAVAYLNLGDALAKLKRNLEAREAYVKCLSLAPHAKSAAEAKKKMNRLTNQE